VLSVLLLAIVLSVLLLAIVLSVLLLAIVLSVLLLAIVLSVLLRFRDSDYPFGIFKLFSRHHDFLSRYDISVSQMTMAMFCFS
jgi:hypothetical protein